MKKKELKKIKKIIGVLIAIVQEHEDREALVRWEDSVLCPKEEADEKGDRPAFKSMYERIAWELENEPTDELRDDLAHGKALGKKINAEYQELLKKWEKAGTCTMARQRVGEEMMEAVKNASVCLPRMS